MKRYVEISVLFSSLAALGACDKEQPKGADAGASVAARPDPAGRPSSAVTSSPSVPSTPTPAVSAPPVATASSVAPVVPTATVTVSAKPAQPKPSASAAAAATTTDGGVVESAMEYKDLIKKVRAKPSDFIGKTMVFKGPHHSLKTDDKNKTVGIIFMASEALGADNVSIIFKNPDAKRLEGLKAKDIVVVRGKIKDWVAPDLEVEDAEILDVQKP